MELPVFSERLDACGFGEGGGRLEDTLFDEV
jgi:hypothetical protein